MEVKTEMVQADWEKSAVAIGKFEGLHAGHHKLINMICEKQAEGYTSVVFSFDKSPRLFFGQGKGALFTGVERRHILQDWSLQCLVECPFTQELASMSPQAFVEDILIDKLRMGYLAVGEDFRFGSNRSGNVELLKQYADKGAFELEVIGKEKLQGEQVSSTLVREALANGDMERVEQMLGYPFLMEGEVVRGNQMGRTWGIPTANLVLPEEKLLPPNGVYFSKVSVEAKIYNGITNIGCKPTIGSHYAQGAETYLYDFDGDLYGTWIKVELLCYRRPEQQFASLEKLIAKLRQDIAAGKDYFARM